MAHMPLLDILYPVLSRMKKMMNTSTEMTTGKPSPPFRMMAPNGEEGVCYWDCAGASFFESLYFMQFAPEAEASVLPHPVNKVAVIAMTAANAVHFLRFFITFSSFYFA